MVNWTSEKDQIILKGIFKFHDIRNSKPLLDYLAKEIGDGCTPKAVSHRLTNLRSSGRPVNGSSPVSTPKKTVATSKAPRTPASGRGNPKAAKSKKGKDVETTSEEDEPLASPSVNRKRARNSAKSKNYAESDASSGDDEEGFTPLSKKVKVELVEEEGVTGAATYNAPLEEDDEDMPYI